MSTKGHLNKEMIKENCRRTFPLDDKTFTSNNSLCHGHKQLNIATP